MFARLLFESFRRQRRRKLLAAAAILLGTTAIAAMAALALGIGDNLARELNATYGANLVIYPKAAQVEASVGGIAVKPARTPLLRERDLGKLKSIFWRNNITAVSPELSVPATIHANGQAVDATLLGTWFHHALDNAPPDFRTGAPVTHPWWKLQGAWPKDDSIDDVVLGSALASKLGVHMGGAVAIGNLPSRVTGIVSTGDTTDDDIIVPLAVAQQIANEPGGVDRVLVTAVTKREDAFARRDPNTLGPHDRDRWYCSPYANSIAFQMNEAIPDADASQLRRIAQGESEVLARISGLMLLIGIGALIGAVLAVSSAMSAAILERAEEMALMRSIGATRATIAGLFFSEVALLAVAASFLGWLGGSLLAWSVARHLFSAAAPFSFALLPVVLLLGLLVATLGAAVPIRRTLNLAPALVLHGGR